ncbi:hypothetical protein [Bacillus clarus]|uniref:Putative membrane protein n=1 Tax=Bacillus clarus TaxID=2338372 RepID=A0A090YU50_9BACI|nr:hypothetical protein [Bacillus clarus]KFN01955.1 putative membrane protein [Bacillus clarus]
MNKQEVMKFIGSLSLTGVVIYSRLGLLISMASASVLATKGSKF